MIRRKGFVLLSTSLDGIALPSPALPAARTHRILPFPTARRTLLARFGPASLVILVLVFLLADRTRLLTHFVFRYTEQDQTLLWYAAEEARHGRFHEPCFYGQSYNSCLEAYAAVPLLACGLPHSQALPLATTFLGLLPYLVLAGLACRQGRWKLAAFILAIPLVLPWEYGMVTAIPRGFVTGLAAATPAAVAWLSGKRPWAWFLAGLCGVAGITLNPNASVLLLAVGLYAILQHYQAWRFYVYSALGALVAIPWPLAIHWFYTRYPAYDFHRPKPLAWTWNDLHKALVNPNSFFAHFAPLYPSAWVVGSIFLLLAMGLLALRQYKAFIAILASVVMIVVSLGVNRIHTGSTSVFLSHSRMFLAIPVLWAVGLVWLDKGLQRRPLWPWLSQSVFLVLLGGILVIGALKHHSFEATSRRWLHGTDPIDVISVERLEDLANRVAATAHQCDAHLVIFPSGRQSGLNYALPVLTHEQIETLHAPYERRTWRLYEEEMQARGKILVDIEEDRQILWTAQQGLGNATVVSSAPRLIQLSTGELPTIQALTKAGIGVRKH